MVLKVYGWRGLKAGMPKQQARFIMAAPSVSAILRATGMSRYAFNADGCETYNESEIKVALSEPGTIFYQGLYDREGEPWMREGS